MDSKMHYSASKFIPDFIINKSDVVLDENEIKLLNNGLNFALPHASPPLCDIIVDSELAVSRIEADKADYVRENIKRTLNSHSNSKKCKNTDDMYAAVKSLNKKKIFITKADKGNCVVVLNENDYNSGMNELIEEGNYVSVKNPLPKMTRQVNEHRKKYANLFGKYWEKNMLKSYVRVPCIYGFFKAHKPGNKFRPIIAGYTAPVANIAKWLCKYFSKFNSLDKFSVKNSIDLIDALKNEKIRA